MLSEPEVDRIQKPLAGEQGAFPHEPPSYYFTCSWPLTEFSSLTALSVEISNRSRVRCQFIYFIGCRHTIIYVLITTT